VATQWLSIINGIWFNLAWEHYHFPYRTQHPQEMSSKY